MREQWIRFLNNEGASASLKYITGDVCPCFTFRDANNPKYDPEWHENNQAAEKCNGDGLINQTTNTKSIKAFFHGPQIYARMYSEKFNPNTPIGELDKYSLIMHGTADTDHNFIDCSLYTEEKAWIEYNSEKYRIKKVIKNDSQDEFSQIIGLEKYEDS